MGNKRGFLILSVMILIFLGMTMMAASFLMFNLNARSSDTYSLRVQADTLLDAQYMNFKNVLRYTNTDGGGYVSVGGGEEDSNGDSDDYNGSANGISGTEDDDGDAFRYRLGSIVSNQTENIFFLDQKYKELADLNFILLRSLRLSSDQNARYRLEVYDGNVFDTDKTYTVKYRTEGAVISGLTTISLTGYTLNSNDMVALFLNNTSSDTLDYRLSGLDAAGSELSRFVPYLDTGKNFNYYANTLLSDNGPGYLAYSKIYSNVLDKGKQPIAPSDLRYVPNFASGIFTLSWQVNDTSLTGSYFLYRGTTPTVNCSDEYYYKTIPYGTDSLTGVYETGSIYYALCASNGEKTGSGSSLTGVSLSTASNVVAVNEAYLKASPLTCPTGFIPVPGNPDFNQSDFCVAQYEMKQATGDAGSWNGTSGTGGPVGTASNPYCTNASMCLNTSGSGTIVSKGAIVSKPEGYPIVNLNQYNAIEACKSMGNGYHLITNNEWMTIARNIESLSINWSGGFISSTGTTNRGQSDGIWGNSSTGALPGTTGEYGIPNSGFKNKRTHTLSNNQIIWDFAGNVWEHVNKTNTLDGSLYSTGTNGLGFTSPKIDMCGVTDNYYEWSACTPSARNLYGPSNSIWSSSNGFGGIWDFDGTVFFRGGDWRYGLNTGVYSLTLNAFDSTAGSTVGFRCAK